jgi:hypothetical protein
MLISSRHSRESGNPGASDNPLAARWRQPIDPTVQLPWTPAFAGVTMTIDFTRFISNQCHAQNFLILRSNPEGCVSKDARRPRGPKRPLTLPGINQCFVC